MAREYPPLSDDHYQRAVRLGEERSRSEAHAIAARYDRKKDMVVIELDSGVISMFPRLLLQGLGEAQPDQLAAVELANGGSALHWQELDVDFSVAGLLAGAFGSKQWMTELERRGEPRRLSNKAAASRSSGKKAVRSRKAHA